MTETHNTQEGPTMHASDARASTWMGVHVCEVSDRLRMCITGRMNDTVLALSILNAEWNGDTQERIQRPIHGPIKYTAFTVRDRVLETSL